jgi:hypothetical protein
MKKLTYPQMLLKLQNRFPTLQVLDNIEFSKDATPLNGFWLRNCESVTYTKKDTNYLYKAMNVDYKNYEFEVYKKFNGFCNRYGWYATSESYTLQVFSL